MSEYKFNDELVKNAPSYKDYIWSCQQHDVDPDRERIFDLKRQPDVGDAE